MACRQQTVTENKDDSSPAFVFHLKKTQNSTRRKEQINPLLEARKIIAVTDNVSHVYMSWRTTKCAKAPWVKTRPSTSSQEVLGIPRHPAFARTCEGGCWGTEKILYLMKYTCWGVSAKSSREKFVLLICHANHREVAGVQRLLGCGAWRGLSYPCLPTQKARSHFLPFQIPPG